MAANDIPTHFADSLGMVGIVNGIVRLEFDEIIVEPNGQGRSHRVARVLLPMSAIQQVIDDLTKARDQFPQMAGAPAAASATAPAPASRPGANLIPPPPLGPPPRWKPAGQ